jgi:tRNA-2-methylthio-N6-dimethylallyladenosine synthase
MNRKHDRDLYLRIVEKLRAAKSDMALTSDFIVGFPGETEADFEDTLRLVDEVGFAMAYSFTYSARPGTPASGLPELPEAVKHERLLRLQEMLWQQQRHFNARLVGQTIPILLEKKGKKDGQLLGKSPWLQSVPVAGEGLSIGQIVQVKIEAAHQTSLAGIVVGVESPLTRVAS